MGKRSEVSRSGKGWWKPQFSAFKVTILCPCFQPCKYLVLCRCRNGMAAGGSVLRFRHSRSFLSCTVHPWSSLLFVSTTSTSRAIKAAGARIFKSSKIHETTIWLGASVSVGLFFVKHVIARFLKTGTGSTSSHFVHACAICSLPVARSLSLSL